MHSCIEELKVKQLKRLFFVSDASKLCKLRYPRHKNGCPNIIENLHHDSTYPKHPECPPYAMNLNKKYDLSKPSFFCYAKFNIEKQAKNMKKKHPEWTELQCRCCYYWQKSVKKTLREKCQDFSLRYSASGRDEGKLFVEAGKQKRLFFELVPEAMGLHVFKTAADIGIFLERNPQNYVYKIAFMGVLK